jgi:hypothetical protein
LDTLPVSELAPDDIKRGVITQIKKHITESDAKPADYDRNKNN